MLIKYIIVIIFYALFLTVGVKALASKLPAKKAAAIDNGCNKPAKLEIKEHVTHADTYNYPSLSASY